MRRSLLALALGLALATSQAKANNYYGGPIKIDAGVNAYFNVYAGSAYLPLAPWYMYWPYDGQVMTPGPMQNAAQWQTWPGGSVVSPPPPRLSYPQQPQAPPAIRPASYNPNAPAYWYGR